MSIIGSSGGGDSFAVLSAIALAEANLRTAVEAVPSQIGASAVPGEIRSFRGSVPSGWQKLISAAYPSPVTPANRLLFEMYKGAAPSLQIILPLYCASANGDVYSIYATALSSATYAIDRYVAATNTVENFYGPFNSIAGSLITGAPTLHYHRPFIFELGDFVWVGGGKYNSTTNVSSRFIRINKETKVTTTLAEIPGTYPVQPCGIPVILGGKAYFFGGYKSNGSTFAAVNTIMSYDISANVWDTAEGTLPSAYSTFSAALLPSGKILVMDTTSFKRCIYNPADRTCSAEVQDVFTTDLVSSATGATGVYFYSTSPKRASYRYFNEELGDWTYDAAPFPLLQYPTNQDTNHVGSNGASTSIHVYDPLVGTSNNAAYSRPCVRTVPTSAADTIHVCYKY